jgi:hypothetical protein
VVATPRSAPDQRKPWRSRGAIWAAITRHGIVPPTRSSPGPRRGPDNYAKPATADIPAAGADVDSGELIAAQPPQVLVMHDASNGSQVRSRSREPPRSDQYLGRGQDGHQDSTNTYGAR